MSKENRKRILISVAAVLFLGLFYLWNRGSESTSDFFHGEGTEFSKESSENVSEKYTTPGGNGSESIAPSEEMIFVEISGAVKSPGVYEIKKDSRLFEALEKSGGVTENGDLSNINQARVLNDGEKIYIPRQGESPPASSSGTENPNTSGLVNINTATETELLTLTGVGPSKAKAIIEYREKHGKFSNPEELRNVTGIGESIFNKIKDLIKV